MPVCHIDDLPEGEAIHINTIRPIAVFNTDGEVYATDDTCTHQDPPLSDGWLEGCLIERPSHAAAFGLRTGVPTCLPAR
jgi:3-phenylpropionate/trans-cinnamate dioxygenase ferredoxin subunit